MAKLFGRKAKGNMVMKLLHFVAWLTGVLVSLAVGFAMIDDVIAVRWIPVLVTEVAGWIVVLTTFLSAVLALLKH